MIGWMYTQKGDTRDGIIWPISMTCCTTCGFCGTWLPQTITWTGAGFGSCTGEPDSVAFLNGEHMLQFGGRIEGGARRIYWKRPADDFQMWLGYVLNAGQPRMSCVGSWFLYVYYYDPNKFFRRFARVGGSNDPKKFLGSWTMVGQSVGADARGCGAAELAETVEITVGSLFDE